MLPDAMFTVKKNNTVPLLVEKTLKFHPRVDQMGAFAACRVNSPGWDGEEEGFEMCV